MSKSNYSSQRSHHQSSRSGLATSRIHNSRYSSTKTINKSKQNSQAQEDYPLFHVHSSDYEIIFANNKTSTDMINKSLNHVDTYKQLGNEIYSWRNMEKELVPAKELFTWPIPAELLDIQPHFPAWYN
ncbi:unnamed protein product [Rotaria sp. Silwood2]|nr:unnamed protein product [Rotaria sp. Silwood2]CAF2678703.1 unnamed protein product [Rotaria sp. Silwood2]CAF4429319.1 unnamed protein product [Rotaria sp. Silwood2]